MTAGYPGVMVIIMAIGIILPLSGICDGDAANDLTLEDGSVVGEAEDPAPFLDSWQVPSSLTSVGQTRFRPDSCATADCSPCLRMVSNRTFSACHRFVRADWAQRGVGASRDGNGSTYLQRGPMARAGRHKSVCVGRQWGSPRGVELGTRLGACRGWGAGLEWGPGMRRIRGGNTAWCMYPGPTRVVL